MLMEWIRQAGDAKLRIRQVEQSDHWWNCAQRQLLQTPEKAMDNEKRQEGPSESAHTHHWRLGLCLHCGEGGHLIMSCPGCCTPAAASGRPGCKAASRSPGLQRTGMSMKGSQSGSKNLGGQTLEEQENS
uniref:Uncharacterized protein n=1 Tax=Sphaerodactylus townsendi TaxID=933632 RepID=A0ACB8F0A8_9SAUR